MSNRPRSVRGGRGRRPNGFTLIELLVVIAIIALLVSILLPALSEARRSSRVAICSSNLKQFAVAMANYGTDFKDSLYTYTWRPGIQYCDEFPAAGQELQSCRDQAVHILHERANADPALLPRITTQWFPQALYGHLIINDFLQQRLPEKMVVCPDDVPRLTWQTALVPGQFTQMVPAGLRPATVAADQAERFPYSSTYFQMPAEWSVDIPVNNTDYVYQDPGTTHAFMIFVGGHVARQRALSEVQFPSQKVYLADDTDRHSFKSQTYYAYKRSKAPIAFFDSSVRTVRTSDTNYGFTPLSPTNYAYPSGVTQFMYQPDVYEPPTQNGQAQELVTGYYRWTRAGLRGIDYGGYETSSGGTPPPGGSGH